MLEMVGIMMLPSWWGWKGEVQVMGSAYLWTYFAVEQDDRAEVTGWDEVACSIPATFKANIHSTNVIHKYNLTPNLTPSLPPPFFKYHSTVR